MEQLTLTGVRDLGLYRAAFTHKSALPPEERTEKVGRGGCRSAHCSRGGGGEGSQGAPWRGDLGMQREKP